MIDNQHDHDDEEAVEQARAETDRRDQAYIESLRDEMSEAEAKDLIERAAEADRGGDGADNPYWQEKSSALDLEAARGVVFDRELEAFRDELERE